MRPKLEKTKREWHRRFRNPTGMTQNDIVNLLREHNDELRYSDLKLKLKTTDPTLSKHLHILQEKCSIQVRKNGKERYYSLTSKANNVPELKIPLFYEVTFDYLEIRMNEISSDNNEIFLKQLAEKIASLLIFSILHSVKTGHDFTKYLNSQEFSRFILYTMIRHLYKGKIPDFLAKYTENEPDPVDYYSISELLMRDSARTDTKFKKLFRDMEKTFFEETEVMKYVYEDPFSRDWITAVNNIYRK